MTDLSTAVFALPDRLAAKAAEDLIAADVRHFAALGRALAESVAAVSRRLEEERRAPAGRGQQALDRDLEVHRLSARLRTLRRYGLDLCLGRMVRADDPVPVYVGRIGLRGTDGRALLVDWRSPAAEPFFGATHADPRGLVSRRRYRWTAGAITDYWDEVFVPEALEGHAALDDQSAFIASLGASRSPRMRDVLATIQADQDAIIRAGSEGALVVDGGPGTGKTVVALHRAAYLLYADPRLGHRRGGVLVVGPHRAYLDYVSDVLPSLGEEGVLACTLRDLVPEGATAGAESDPEVARLKGSADLVRAVAAAVRFYERPPTRPLEVATPWGTVRLEAADWAEAFAAPEAGTPHNDARDDVWEGLLAILVDKVADLAAETGDGEMDEDDDYGARTGADDFDAYGLTTEDRSAEIRRVLARDADLAAALGRAWPRVAATDLVADLWSVPAYLRLCAPWLTPAEVAALQRPDPAVWTDADLPFLDAARRLLGDPEAARRRRRRQAALADQGERMADVVGDLIAHDDSDMHVMAMLRGQDLRAALAYDAGEDAEEDRDRFAGPFAHVVVDEAQELTDAQWEMLLARCPSRSLTVVGDRAQARAGFREQWADRLARVGVDRVRVAPLRVNYRTPSEVMAEAEPVIRAAVPDANVPTSVRSTGVPVQHGVVADLDRVLGAWLAEHSEGLACVIGDPDVEVTARVRSHTAEDVKGLEFDLVVLVRPDLLGVGVRGAVDRYVAMTRATQRLVVLA